MAEGPEIPVNGQDRDAPRAWSPPLLKTLPVAGIEFNQTGPAQDFKISPTSS